MKILSILLIISMTVLSGCVSTPEFFEAVYSQSPSKIPAPNPGNTIIVFEAKHPKWVRIDGFNNNAITGTTRNGINAAEFVAGKANLSVGLFHMYGELNYRKEMFAEIEYDFEANTKYQISFSGESPTLGIFILSKYIENGKLERIAQYRAQKI